MSKSPYDIILHPLLTEKSSALRGDLNQICFIVQLGANKVEIRQAVEKIFGVRVQNVRTQIVRGKIKRFGRNQGKRPNRKKAIVSLYAGESIELFETVA